MKEFELEPGEHIVLQTRKHWFLFLADLLPYAILLIIPFAIPNILKTVPPLAPYGVLLDYHSIIGRAVLGTWLLVVWTGAWGSFTRYFLNAWILTNQRIVEIKQPAFFNREVSSLFLGRIQDATTDVHGVLSSLLGIGTINVQSAGAKDEFIMRGIPRPEQMRDVILKYASAHPKDTGV